MTHTLYRGYERVVPDAAIQILATENKGRIQAIRDAKEQFPQCEDGTTFDEILSSKLVQIRGTEESYPLNSIQLLSFSESRCFALPARLTSLPDESKSEHIFHDSHHFYNQGDEFFPHTNQQAKMSCTQNIQQEVHQLNLNLHY